MSTKITDWAHTQKAAATSYLFLCFFLSLTVLHILGDILRVIDHIENIKKTKICLYDSSQVDPYNSK